MLKLVILLGVTALGSAASAAQFNQTWTDVNYVPCEGMGFSGSGTIEVSIDYKKIAATPPQEVRNFRGDLEGTLPGAPAQNLIKSITVRTGYPHAHQPAGRLDYTSITGSSRTLTLVAPWYTTVKSADDDKQTLVGPRPPASARKYYGPTDQQMINAMRGRSLKLVINTRFPQEASNCASSFSKQFDLP